MFENEKIYIAGPECFYPNGQLLLKAMRCRVESLGFGVTLPNDHPLDMENPQLKKRADSIFADLEKVMMDSTVIVADLEAFRGSEPDSGTVYEIGMAYARGIRCYGYTRDKRPLACKDQKYRLKDGAVYDEHGKPAAYKELPFSVCVVGSTKIIEGGFDDCLKALMTDLEEEYKRKGRGEQVRETGGSVLETGGSDSETAADLALTQKERGTEDWAGKGAAAPSAPGRRPIVYLSGPERYEEGAEALYIKMKEICGKYGMEARTPLDAIEGETVCEGENPYMRAARLFERYQRHVRECDLVIANLNDYRGYECSNDTGFECGMAYQLGKAVFGYMEDAGPMKERVPHLGEENGFRDPAGCNVENFDYPLNLMFGCSMRIFEGGFEEAVRKVAEIFLRG